MFVPTYIHVCISYTQYGCAVQGSPEDQGEAIYIWTDQLAQIGDDRPL